MVKRLTKAKVESELKKLDGWKFERDFITKTFEFKTFMAGIKFVDDVAQIAEEEEHHPDIDIRYNKVRLLLSTHSKGGLTELDFGLAERIDTLAE